MNDGVSSAFGSVSDWWATLGRKVGLPHGRAAQGHTPNDSSEPLEGVGNGEKEGKVGRETGKRSDGP